MFQKIVKRFVIPLTLAFIFIIIFANQVVKNSANESNFHSLISIPSNKVGLLLGTSKQAKRGINQYFLNRINATVDLYNSGKIKMILVSGDNSEKTYDEPTDMLNALVKAGIPKNKIVLDYAGFSTYESVSRAKHIFCLKEFTIISQKFHNERAIYLAKSIGLKVVAYNAEDVSVAYGLKTKLRESLARVLALKDAWIQPKPTFLGEKIKTFL
jgi:SanA protein